MDLTNFLGSGLFSIFITVCVCASTIIPLGAAGFFLFRMFKNMNQNSGLVKTGVPASAVIIGIQDTGVTMNDSPQVRLTLQVTPADRPPFQAMATTFVGRLQIGMITPGASVTVRYDPNDISKVAIESLGAPSANSGNIAAIQAAMQQQDQYYEQLRKTGEEARAKILTVSDMNIRVGDSGSMFRLTFDVTPQIGSPFKAETQAAIADTSREKYSVGRMVYVRYDPNNKAQVALDRAA
ncbi:MAG: DUF3592 domain-containing protein [Chloroflexi bacterium]|nr:DUF3592 domain-containing protein [Chloroflexota bacterium]